MKTLMTRIEESVYGTYKSVNDMPEFADEGPFDPEVMVTVIRSVTGGYTIDGVDSSIANPDGSTTTLVYNDIYMFEEQGGVNGFIPSIGPNYVDFGGVRYAALGTQTVEGTTVIYAILLMRPDGSTGQFQYALEIPSDHPFLRTFRTNVVSE